MSGLVGDALSLLNVARVTVGAAAGSVSTTDSISEGTAAECSIAQRAALSAVRAAGAIRALALILAAMAVNIDLTFDRPVLGNASSMLIIALESISAASVLAAHAILVLTATEGTILHGTAALALGTASVVGASLLARTTDSHDGASSRVEGGSLHADRVLGVTGNFLLRGRGHVGGLAALRLEIADETILAGKAGASIAADGVLLRDALVRADK